jgi:hypothetical protein
MLGSAYGIDLHGVAESADTDGRKGSQLHRDRRDDCAQRRSDWLRPRAKREFADCRGIWGAGWVVHHGVGVVAVGLGRKTRPRGNAGADWAGSAVCCESGLRWRRQFCEFKWHGDRDPERQLYANGNRHIRLHDANNDAEANSPVATRRSMLAFWRPVK